ncbi:ribonuclease P protein component [Synoicihabitans lomoniglobus]|uniref:Ribonuclease P protein component n=1 Tax=Synoicihabitans lomoniglobus TaxID=2909285 RepID=A0AAE9ZZX9_9BACT|nr:ribonuclease P protein component [Opitutaceae bacterium LMO-M01]WED63817.1 ribonuclease P protein component [Opitutaceae bacterium LMO-M01]
MRFRAESHLRRPAEFAKVRASGRRYHCGGFVLWAAHRPAPSEGTPPAPTGPRAGFVASKAAVGNAVARNRAKRRLREVFRHHQSLVPMDMDLILQARRSLNRLEYAEIERKFLKACADLFPARSI